MSKGFSENEWRFSVWDFFATLFLLLLNTFKGEKTVSRSEKDFQDNWISLWVTFYETHFGITLQTENLEIPQRKHGFDFLVIVPEGLTLGLILQVCSKMFRCRLEEYGGLHSVRDTRKTYALWLRTHASENEKHIGVFPRDLNTKKNHLTPSEYLLYVMMLFVRGWSGKGDTFTLCAGAYKQLREVITYIPVIYWSPLEKLLVLYFVTPDFGVPNVEVREILL